MLEVDGISAEHGAVRALREVSFTAAKGQITAVLGANGAGKTTLLRVLSGLHRPSAGRVRLGGEDITAVAPERMSARGLAHVPEGRGVITQLTVSENLRLGALGARGGSGDGPKGEGAHLDVERVHELFPVLGDRRESPADTLSGGERQMLVIGRALLARPRVLLLDEPSLGLAPRVVAQILTVVRELVDTSGLTVLLVEQNARSALSVADHGVVLGLGRVVADRPAAVLADDDELRHAYLGF